MIPTSPTRKPVIAVASFILLPLSFADAANSLRCNPVGLGNVFHFHYPTLNLAHQLLYLPLLIGGNSLCWSGLERPNHWFCLCFVTKEEIPRFLLYVHQGIHRDLRS